MEIKALVTHKHLKSLGIGIVSEKMKKSFRVKFGQNDVRKFHSEFIRFIDTSKSKFVSMDEIKQKAVKNDNAIFENCLKQYSGSEWMFIRIITEEDLEKYPRVLENNV